MLRDGGVGTRTLLAAAAVVDRAGRYSEGDALAFDARACITPRAVEAAIGLMRGLGCEHPGGLRTEAVALAASESTAV